MGPWEDAAQFYLAKLVGYEGPQCFRMSADGEPETWCLLLDAKNSGYEAFITHDLAGGQFEKMPEFSTSFRLRHGSILPISSEEKAKLQSSYSGFSPQSPASPLQSQPTPATPAVP